MLYFTASNLKQKDRPLQLSIIIVNYNVRYFLEQCLCSVQKAIEYGSLAAEVIVVDNNSTDGSLEMLVPAFPTVRFLPQPKNLGFSKACNFGARSATGELLLFLNPDTLLPENCFTECITFFRNHQDAGALGLRMIDGTGSFLKESKRSFPSPLTSFFKLSGLAHFFPRSKLFGRYHLGHLDEMKTHSVDVLAGAFLMVRKTLFEKIDGFDEAFFMYGEDIDLSYRIQKAGFKNYYFPGVSILHFKGESTRRGSMNYVRMFYLAMSIFVRKHYGGGKARIFHFFIQLAIWLRAGLSAFSRLIKKAGMPVLDAALIFVSFRLSAFLWARYIKKDVVYDANILSVASIVFTVSFLIAAYYAGLYDKWVRRGNVFRSNLIAGIAVLALYSLVPEKYRFSRGIILLSAFIAFLAMSVLRLLLTKAGMLQKPEQDPTSPDILIVGSETEYNRVLQLLEHSEMNDRVLGRIAPGAYETGTVMQASQLGNSTIYFREIIFCEGSLNYASILNHIEKLPRNKRMRIHSSGSKSIVGSDSKDQTGETLSTIRRYQLADPYRRRLKRLIDFVSSFLFLLSFPLHLLFQKNAGIFLRNCVEILWGYRSWIGYHSERPGLPALKKAVLDGNGLPLNCQYLLPETGREKIDEWYASNYEPSVDLRLIITRYRRLGGAPPQRQDFYNT